MKTNSTKFFLIAIALIISLFTGCNQASKASSNNNSAEKKNTSIDFKYAKGFQVQYLDGDCKLVVDSAGKKFLLVPNGKTAPKGYEDAKIISTPVKKVAAFSTTYVSALRSIGELSSIAAVTTEKNKWYIDEIKKGLDAGNITYVGNQASPNYEQIKAINPDIAILHTGSSSQEEQIAKLEELGITCISYNEHMQDDPLGKIEAVRVLAAFFNKDEAAQNNFNKVESNIKAVSDKVKSVKKPKVAYAYILKGLVYVPNEGSYVAKMIELAGGDYIFSDIGKNDGAYSKISVEEFYAKAKNADVLIYDNTSDLSVKNLSDLVNNNNILKDISPITNGKVCGINPTYWQDTDKMDTIIKDMSAAIYPEQYSDYKPNYYYKLK